MGNPLSVAAGIVTCLLVVVSLGACGGGSNGSTRTDARIDSATEFDWSGGVAGRDDRLTIQPSGEVKLVSGPPADRQSVELQLDERQLTSLEKLLSDADIAGLKRTNFGPKYPIPDGFLFTIKSEDRVVTYGDGGDPIPSSLGRLGEFLRELVDKTKEQ